MHSSLQALRCTQNLRTVGSYVTKNDFIRRTLLSSLLTAIATALIFTFCILLFIQYTEPNEENTAYVNGTVSEIYHGGKNRGLVIIMSNGEQFQLVYPNFSAELYSEIGYDLDALHEMLEGERIEYRRMDALPWIVEINVNGTVIDNTELTVKQIILSRICIVIIGIIMLAFPVCGEVAYIKKQYRYYRKAEKKRRRKARKSLNNA